MFSTLKSDLNTSFSPHDPVVVPERCAERDRDPMCSGVVFIGLQECLRGSLQVNVGDLCLKNIINR